jgi:hypothetical protein
VTENKNHLRQKEKSNSNRDEIVAIIQSAKIVVQNFKAKISAQNHGETRLHKESITLAYCMSTNQKSNQSRNRRYNKLCDILKIAR